MEHTYYKNPFDTTSGRLVLADGTIYDARSGMHPFSFINSGCIPNGTYRAGRISNTRNIKRYFLDPDQDIGTRCYLQVHQKSPILWRDVFGMDTKGCIAVDKEAMTKINTGDKFTVTVDKPDYKNYQHVTASMVMHNSLLDSYYHPKDYFEDIPENTGGCIMF